MSSFVQRLFEPALSPAERVLASAKKVGSNAGDHVDEEFGFVAAAFFEHHDDPSANVPVRIAYRNCTPNRYTFTFSGEGNGFAQEVDYVRLRATPTRNPLAIIDHDPLGRVETLSEGDWIDLVFKPDEGTTASEFSIVLVAGARKACPCCN